MKLIDLYQEQDRLLGLFKADLDIEIASGRTLTEDQMYDHIVQWAQDRYVYDEDQWEIATACRFSSDGDFNQVFEDAHKHSDDVNGLMSACAQLFAEHCIREQFGGYEIIADEEVA